MRLIETAPQCPPKSCGSVAVVDIGNKPHTQTLILCGLPTPHNMGQQRAVEMWAVARSSMY